MENHETDNTQATEPAYEGWAILELMGHRQTAGKVAEVTVAGQAMLRIDTPGANGEMVASQFYSSSAVYCMTPCTEDTARQALAERCYGLPAPVRLAIEQSKPAISPDAEDVDPDEGGDFDPDDDHPF